MNDVAMIVAVCGLPGSGKSYFAERLAEGIGAVYISSDMVRKEMYAERTYSDKEKLTVYREMVARATQAIAEKKDVVLDATFHRKDIRDLVKNSFESPLRWIEVRADESIIRERLAKPRRHSEADYEVYLKIRSQWEPIDNDHLILASTQRNISEMLGRAIQYLHHDKG